MKLAIVSLTLIACGSKPAPIAPASYGIELEECNRTAKTCEESISCENRVRARHGRPLRTGGCE